MLGTGTPEASHSRATWEPRVWFRDTLRGPSRTGGTVDVNVDTLINNDQKINRG